MTRCAIDGLQFARAMLASATAAASIALVLSLLTLSNLEQWALGHWALYFLFLYIWTFPAATAFGLPAYILARWRGLDNFAIAATYGASVGLGFGYWIGGGQLYGLALYGALGIMGGTVFLLMMKHAPYFRRAGSVDGAS